MVTPLGPKVRIPKRAPVVPSPIESLYRLVARRSQPAVRSSAMSNPLKNAQSAHLAGGILVLNAALALIGSLCRQPLGPGSRVVAIIDLALGASLLSGRGWRTITIARCMLGAVVLTGFEVADGHAQVMNGDWAAAATELLFSVGI